MKSLPVFLLIVHIATALSAFAQNRSFIYSKEGKIALNRYNFINNCLLTLHKDNTDKTALAICECQADKVDGHFTNQQYKKLGNGDKIDLSNLVKQDTAFSRELQLCYTNSGKTFLIEAESFKEDFVNSCMQSIAGHSVRKYDTVRVRNFCNCQLNLVTSKQIADEEIKTMDNPNSILFFEMMYKCGNPFRNDQETGRDWNENAGKDVTGPVSDSIRVLNMDGMTYVKLKTGSMVQFWLFDTGATDLLINKEMEELLKKEGVISPENYLGIGNYEMANGMTDTCRKYRLNNIQIGRSKVSNVVVAVSDKGKRIIVGKGLLNKFSNWILDNKNSILILNR